MRNRSKLFATAMTSSSTPQPSTAPIQTKAIPPARDRLQSHLLVCFALLILGCSVAYEWTFFYRRYDFKYLTQITAVSLIFALTAWCIRAATASAAVCGGAICLLVSTNCFRELGDSVFRSGLVPLLLLFALTFCATSLGRDQKASNNLAESRSGRNAGQVIANLGIAAIFNSAVGWYFLVSWSGWNGSINGDDAATRTYFAIPLLPMLAALTEATADTVSSEIGQAFGGTPFMLTNLRRAAPGTDGAITPIGTMAGLVAAALIAATGVPALHMNVIECAIAFAAGIGGLFFDSLLGATLERRGYIGNDLVNFLSTAFAAFASLAAIRLLRF